MRKRNDWGKRILALSLAGAMAFTSVVLLPTEAKAEESTTVTEAKYLNLEEAETEFYVGTDWAGSEASVSATGNKAVIDVANWGGGNEWGIQYMVHNLKLEQNAEYTIECDLLSTVDAKIFVKLDDSGMIGEWVELKANTPYHFSAKSTPKESTKPTLFFALGMGAAEPGKLTISNITGVECAKVDTSTGAEYDFTAVSHEGDYADPGTVKEGYDLIWADEFDGNYGSDNLDADTGLNLSKWAYQLGDGTTDCNNQGWGNAELECYTSDRKNIAVNEDLNGDGVNDGYLRITAAYEKDGRVYEDESPKNYTSARIRTTSATQELFNMTYGYVEARMSLPATKGAWPAFWMLPQSTDIYGGWPVSGEIDIMETNGGETGTCSTLHWGAPEHVYKGSGYTELSSAYTNFHTYAVDWEPGKITFYNDGVAIYTSENWESGFAGASDTLSFDAPFDQPYYMLLNLAVDSGRFGGSANKAAFQGNINMYVDYVRAYQKSAGYAGTATRKASDSAKEDWADYAGKNQIADLTAASVKGAMSVEGGMNDAEADMANWYLSYQSDATDAVISAETKDDTDWAKIGITSKGANDYSVQLIGHYNAKAGYVYKVSFDAYADGNMVGKTVNCDSKEWAGWSTYGIQSFDLKDTPAGYSYLVSQTEDFERCRIEFNLGAQDSGNVYIGNVKVEIVDPSAIAQESDIRKPLANGDIIYNGTFDQGNNHIGYWTSGKGTKFVVPRYTTKKLASTDKSVVDVASKINKNSKIHVAGGVKYYERRAQISAPAGVKPRIYQTDLTMPKDSYALSFDMYAKKPTSVTAAIYTVDISKKDGKDVKKLGKKVLSKKLSYNANAKVKKLKWNFKLDKKIDNAALVLTFADGTSVQVDNVSLIGDSLGAKIDKTPMNSKTTWITDGCELNVKGGVATATGITSGEAWYAPQIISSKYSLSAGQTYKLSFQYKMSGTSNNTGEYIIQEDGGSWTTYGNGETKFTYDKKKADKDGYCSYSIEIPATVTLDTVHMVFGFGNSEAKDAKFSFKNVKMTLVEPKAANKITGVKSAYTKTTGAKAFTLKAKGQGKITYVSSNKKVATVNKTTGKVTIKGAGTATITVKAAGNSRYQAATRKITIKVTKKK